MGQKIQFGGWPGGFGVGKLKQVGALIQIFESGVQGLSINFASCN